MHFTKDDDKRNTDADRPALTTSDDAYFDAEIANGVSALRASGRLLYEDDALDRALVLEILQAVMGERHD